MADFIDLMGDLSQHAAGAGGSVQNPFSCTASLPAEQEAPFATHSSSCPQRVTPNSNPCTFGSATLDFGASLLEHSDLSVANSMDQYGLNSIDLPSLMDEPTLDALIESADLDLGDGV